MGTDKLPSERPQLTSPDQHVNVVLESLYFIIALPLVSVDCKQSRYLYVWSKEIQLPAYPIKLAQSWYADKQLNEQYCRMIMCLVLLFPNLDYLVIYFSSTLCENTWLAEFSEINTDIIIVYLCRLWWQVIYQNNAKNRILWLDIKTVNNLTIMLL